MNSTSLIESLPIQRLFDCLIQGVSPDEFIDDFQIQRSAAQIATTGAGPKLSLHAGSEKQGER